MSVKTIVGALLFLMAAFLWGRERGKREAQTLYLAEGLYSLADYTQARINSFRTPLFRIFNDFSNGFLEECGFIKSLREEGIVFAVGSIADELPDEVREDVLSFAAGLGGGYCEEQVELCRYTKERLLCFIENAKNTLPARLRMYRLLPVLLASTLIILLI